MRKAVVAVTFGLVLVLGAPGRAWAKGPESVTITGPGIDEPIEVALSGPATGRPGAPPVYLVAALTALDDPFEAAAGGMPAPDQLVQDLDHVTLTWTMFHDESTAAADYTVVQDVYPTLGTGPLIHTHPSPFLDSGSAWTEARTGLRETLAALGVPIPGLKTGLQPATKTVVRSSGSSGPPAWALPAAAAAGVLAGLGAARAGRYRPAAWRPARRPKKVPSPSEMPLA